MKVDGAYKSILQGVSQQPPRERLPGQASAQENMLSDPVKSLTRRPPTDMVARLGAATVLKGWHRFTARDGQKFILWFHDNTLQVYDLNGVEQTVVFGTGVSSFLSASGKVRCFTDEDDVTVCVNDGLITQLSSDVTSYYNDLPRRAGIIQILGGQYGKTYKILINGSVAASYTTPDGSNAAESNNIATTNIAAELEADFSFPGISSIRKEDVILLVSNTVDFTVTASDGVGNINVKAMNKSVPTSGDLPRIAPHKYVARIAEKSDPEKDIWLQFIVEGHETDAPNGSLFGLSGYWQECAAPGINYKFNPSTMPVTLTYDSGTFTMEQPVWGERSVGTLVSNPDPSFVGKRIVDVASFQGRLTFISGANVIMSKTNKPYDFWFGSASALADSDPVDINSSVDSSNFASVVQHNRDLVVFSNSAQFIVYGKNRVTSETAALTLSTRFAASTAVKPVSAGRNLFFAAKYGNFTAIREFFTEGGTEINDSRPVTQHVKEYLSGAATFLSCSSNYDTLLVHTDSDRNNIWIYQYIWSDQDKVMSAWHRWTFPYPVYYSTFDDDLIYTIQKIDGYYYLVRMPLDVQDDPGVPYPVHLDYRFDQAYVNTSVPLPYSFYNRPDLLIVQGEDCPNPGMLAKVSGFHTTGPTTYADLSRDMHGGSVVGGIKYKSLYRPTNPFVRDADGVVIGTGKLRVAKFLVSLGYTGHLAGKLSTKYGDYPEVPFYPRTIGYVDNVLGQEVIVDGIFTMPVRMENESFECDFYTDSHMPMTILDIEYVGQYNKRGKRVTGQGG